ncbi:MAG: hypothetical protein CVV33_09525, partial [Methanomicrobiales archaeon HGW-Methanomicrobiales-4]
MQKWRNLVVPHIHADKKNRWLSSFPDLNPNPIIEMDTRGGITYANPAALGILRDLGCTEDPSLFFPDDMGEILHLFKEGADSRMYREIALNSCFFSELIIFIRDLHIIRIYATDITTGKLAEDELVQKNNEILALKALLASARDELSTFHTENSGVEADLQICEEHFRLALRNAPVSVAVQDTDLVFQWGYNQRTVRPEDIRGKKDTDLFIPEEANQLIALKRNVLATRKRVHKKIWLTMNRKRLFLDLFLEPLYDENGKISGVGIATVDLTDQKLIEDALRHSQETLQQTQELLEAVTKGTDVIIAAQDVNYQYTFFN